MNFLYPLDKIVDIYKFELYFYHKAIIFFKLIIFQPNKEHIAKQKILFME